MSWVYVSLYSDVRTVGWKLQCVCPRENLLGPTAALGATGRPLGLHLADISASAILNAFRRVFVLIWQLFFALNIDSSVVLMQPNKPTTHARGGVSAGSNKRWLSGKIITLYVLRNNFDIVTAQVSWSGNIYDLCSGGNGFESRLWHWLCGTKYVQETAGIYESTGCHHRYLPNRRLNRY